jgi:hypothetical protein
MELRWEDPPGRSRNIVDYDEVLAELQEWPGKTAVVLEGTSKQVQAAYAAMKRRGCRVSMRTDKASKQATLWASWPKGE